MNKRASPETPTQDIFPMAFDKDEVTLKSLFLRRVRYFHLELKEKIEKEKIIQREREWLTNFKNERTNSLI